MDGSAVERPEATTRSEAGKGHAGGRIPSERGPTQLAVKLKESHLAKIGALVRVDHFTPHALCPYGRGIECRINRITAVPFSGTQFKAEGCDVRGHEDVWHHEEFIGSIEYPD